MRLAPPPCSYARKFDAEWSKLAFDEVKTGAVDNGHLFRVPVRLGALTPDQVLVELYAAGLNGTAALRIPLVLDTGSSANGTYHYQALVTTTRPVGDFTVRLSPQYKGIAVPLEDNRILWPREIGLTPISMPLVPSIGIGVIPVLHFTVLPVLIYGLSSYLTARKVMPSSLKGVSGSSPE